MHTVLFINAHEIYKIIYDLISMNQSKIQNNLFSSSITVSKCSGVIAIQVPLIPLILPYGV